MEKKSTKIAYFVALGVFIVLLVILGIQFKGKENPVFVGDGAFYTTGDGVFLDGILKTADDSEGSKYALDGSYYVSPEAGTYFELSEDGNTIVGADGTEYVKSETPSKDVNGVEYTTYEEQVYSETPFAGTFWSLLPPIVAIVLALISKEVYSSLFLGCLVGALLYTQFAPWDTIVTLVGADYGIISVLADSGINSIADLAGKRVVVGTPASSASTMGWTVLSTYGLTDKDVKGSELSIAEGVEALKNGDVDCVFIFSAAPNSALTELSVTKNFKLLSIDEEHQKAAIEQHSYFSTATLSADLYTCTSEDTTTLAMPTLLACDSSLSNEAAYQFVKGIYENLDVISTSHAMAAKINLDHAANINLEIHPGALQYYREMGIVD